MRQLKPEFKDLMTMPVWAIYALILMTVMLSGIILAYIWFPNYFGEEFFWKIIGTYIVLVLSTAVISKMADALKRMASDDSDK
tara:strand:+ start:348 stop:596 length:249 start_codon:yes stop_codon:yes gene_type:complete